MSTITNIRDTAASSKGNVQDALLQCLVLADELQYEPLQQWAEWELSGYPTEDLLPPYRITRSALRCTLFEGNRYTTQYTVPEELIPEEIRNKVAKVYIYDPISKLMNVADDGKLHQSLSVTPHLESIINLKLAKDNGHGFIFVRSVSLPIPPGTFAGVIGSVKMKIVQFMIQLNRMFPTDQDVQSASSEQKQAVDQLFRAEVTNITYNNYGTMNTRYTQTDQSTTINTTVIAGQFGSLANYLKAHGVSDEAINQLEPIAEGLEGGNISDDTRRAFESWLGEQVDEVGDALEDVAKDSAKKALTETIVQGIKAFAPKAGNWLANVDFPDIPLG